MTVYFILVFTICLVYFLSKRLKNSQGNKLFLTFSFIALTLIFGLRDYSIGTDTKVYVEFFNWVSNSKYFSYVLSHSIFEIGFVIYTKLITLFTDNVTVYLFISAALCVGPVILIISKYSKNSFLSIILYVFLRVYFTEMCLMRQALAVSIYLLAVLLYLDKKNSKFKNLVAITLIVIASSFHVSAILYFAVFGLTMSKKSLITIENGARLSIIISIALVVFYEVLMNTMIIILPRYAAYFTSEWSDANYNASIFNFLIQLVFLIIGTVFVKNEQPDSVTNFSITVLFLSVVFYALSIRMEIWERAAFDLSIFTPLLWVPEFVSKIKKYKNRLLVESSIVICSFTYMIIVETFRSEWASCVPYKFFWQ